jgi:triosephosphate isomerase
MNINHEQAHTFIRTLVDLGAGQWVEDIDVGILPPFTSLEAVHEEASHLVWNLAIGAQNVSPTKSGAYTGDISADMLAAIDCSYVLIGHSEQREYHPEDNSKLAEKTKAVIDAGMTPVICVGETIEDRLRDSGPAMAVKQLDEIMRELPASMSGSIIIAYEPLWAIGTGQNADAHTANKAVNELRSYMESQFGHTTAANTRILYGGSVSADNANELMSAKCVDGFLIGGASLDPYHFTSIMEKVGESARERLANHE